MGGIPFSERKSVWRAPLDLVTGRYPAFLFGGGLGRGLPVFHFHDVTASYLEPYLAHLAENKYATVTSDALAALARDGISPGPGHVALCFDDGWASLWTVAFPLLKRYGLRAIAYAVPGRIEDADQVRPHAVDETPVQGESGERSPALATWPELRALHESGVVDIQAHTYSHGLIFCSPECTGFITPDYRRAEIDQPVVEFGAHPVSLGPDTLGAPLFTERSRMSDALWYKDDATTRQRCTERVRDGGGAAFFSNPDWNRILSEIAAAGHGTFETEADRHATMLAELTRARAALTERLESTHVHQICFPWAVCGRLAESLLADAGFDSAVADQLFGKRLLLPHGPPHRIMRLKHQYIFCLPGRPRRAFFHARYG